MKTALRLVLVIVLVGAVLVWLIVAISQSTCGAGKYIVKSVTRIDELADGCEQYKQDNKHYPGQANPDEIGSGAGKVTGAQVLAQAMFTKEMSDGLTTYPVSQYATYMDGDLIDADGREALITDRYPVDKRPVLYYPARIGVDGMAQFVEADNAAHTDGNKGGDFQEFIRIYDDPDKATHPRAGKFLLIAPGDDRVYFTGDDLTNYSRPMSIEQSLLSYVTLESVGVAIIVAALLLYALRKKKRTSRMMML